MYRIVRAAFAALALLALPQFASAGPIRWSYFAEGADNTMLVNVTGLTTLDYETASLQHTLTAGALGPTQDPLHETLRTQATVFVTDEPSGEFVVVPFYFDLIREYTFKAD